MKAALVAVGLLAGLVLLAPPAQAQMAGVRGKVVDEEGKGVAGAAVVIESLRKPNTYETQTNGKGEYLQLGIELGPYRITATREGYLGDFIDVPINGVVDVAKLELEVAPPPEMTQAELNEMCGRAVKYDQGSQWDEAEGAFKEILELQPELAEVHGNIGFVYAKQEDWANAEASYLTALDLRPLDPDLMFALAMVYRDSGQDAKAQEVIDQVASQNPDDGASQVRYGVFLLNSGRTDEAQAAFEAAVAVDPTAAEAHYHLGTLLVGQGKVPEAIEHLEAYLAMSPENAQAVATAQGLIEALKK